MTTRTTSDPIRDGLREGLARMLIGRSTTPSGALALRRSALGELRLRGRGYDGPKLAEEPGFLGAMEFGDAKVVFRRHETHRVAPIGFYAFLVHEDETEDEKRNNAAFEGLPRLDLLVYDRPYAESPKTILRNGFYWCRDGRCWVSVWDLTSPRSVRPVVRTYPTLASIVRDAEANLVAPGSGRALLPVDARRFDFLDDRHRVLTPKQAKAAPVLRTVADLAAHDVDGASLRLGRVCVFRLDVRLRETLARSGEGRLAVSVAVVSARITPVFLFPEGQEDPAGCAGELCRFLESVDAELRRSVLKRDSASARALRLASELSGEGASSCLEESTTRYAHAVLSERVDASRLRFVSPWASMACALQRKASLARGRAPLPPVDFSRVALGEAARDAVAAIVARRPGVPVPYHAGELFFAHLYLARPEEVSRGLEDHFRNAYAGCAEMRATLSPGSSKRGLGSILEKRVAAQRQDVRQVLYARMAPARPPSTPARIDRRDKTAAAIAGRSAAVAV